MVVLDLMDIIQRRTHNWMGKIIGDSLCTMVLIPITVDDIVLARGCNVVVVVELLGGCDSESLHHFKSLRLSGEVA